MNTIAVTAGGTVLLSEDITCDGFYPDRPFRIQSHIHEDHLADFDRSKGNQRIYLSRASYDLLVFRKNSDLVYHSNIKPVECGKWYPAGFSKFRVWPSGHILGSLQIEVLRRDGIRVGYSGDFAWPLDNVIKVDVLVVDSTYGSPKKRMYYSDSDAQQQLSELIRKQLSSGPVQLSAHSGTLEHLLDSLSDSIRCPVLASSQTYAEAQIYRKHGYSIPPLVRIDSSDGKRILKKKAKHIHIMRQQERNPALLTVNAKCSVITISAYRTNPSSPIINTGDNSFTVALTRHANFEGTLEYIRKTGAKKIITDSSRGEHAWDLAHEVQRRLRIKAHASTNKSSKEWGK